MKKGNGKRLLAALMATAMVFGMTACDKNGDKGGTNKNGGKSTVDNSALAKQGVYHAKDFSFMKEEDADGGIRTIHRVGDRIYAVVVSYDFDDATNADTMRASLYNMNPQGEDVKKVDLQLPEMPESEMPDAPAEPIGEQPEGEGDQAQGDQASGGEMHLFAEAESESSDEEVTVDAEGAFETFVGEDIDNGFYDGYYGGYSSNSIDRVVIGENSVYAIMEHYGSTYDPEGDAYIDENKNYVCSFAFDGTLNWMEEFDINQYMTDENWVYLSGILALPDDTAGILLSGDKSGVIAVSKGKKSTLQQIKTGKGEIDWEYGVVDRGDGTAIVSYYDTTDYSKQYLGLIDLKKNELVKEYSVPQDARSMGFYNFTEGVRKEIIFSNQNGVFGFNLGDESSEKIMDFVNSDVDSNSLNDIVNLDENTFLATSYGDMDGRLQMAIYTYVKPEDVQERKIIVLAGNGIYSDIRRQVIAFNKKSNEYRITLRDYSEFATEEDWDAGYTKLNNDIIAGDIPDILCIDANGNLPLHSFVSKGLLANIDELIQKDPELSGQDFMDNVFEAYRIDGKLYQIIPNFSVRTWIGKKSIFGDRTSITMDELNSIKSQMNGDVNLFGGEYTRESFINDMMWFCGTEFVDLEKGKCNFKTQLFTDFLEYAKKLPAGDQESGYDEEYWQEYMKNYQTQFRENRTLLMEAYFSDAYGIKYDIQGYMGAPVSYVGFPSENGTGSFVFTYNTYAISAKSANIDGAWEFLKLFFTEEYQKNEDYKYGYHDGFPILKHLTKALIDETTERPYWTDENGEKQYYDDSFWINGESITIDPLTKDQAEELFNFICSIKNTNYNDNAILKIVSEECQEFFSGSKSAQDVAGNIQNRAQLYVNENK